MELIEMRDASDWAQSAVGRTKSLCGHSGVTG